MDDEPEQQLSWYQALQQDPEYYTNTKQGQEELAKMIRQESERLLEEIGRSVKRTKEIIWLSKFCSACRFYDARGSRTMCQKWNVRVVKPFYGRPVWEKVPGKNTDEKVLVVADVDWDQKWKEISDKIVEWAVEKVNGGYPYFCFASP